MPRPTVDANAMRARMVDKAEQLLRQSRGRRLVLSDIAAELGMSQSNAHRYFPTKHDLVAALAERWFAEVAKAARKAVQGEESPRERVISWVLAIMRVKRARFDEDSELFRAYLALASQHVAIAKRHADELRAIVSPAIVQITGKTAVIAELDLLEDATVQFRNPYMIAMLRERATAARARAATRAVLDFVERGGS